MRQSITLKCGHQTRTAKKISGAVKTIQGMVTKFHCSKCRAKYNKIVLGEDVTWTRVA
jgi:hypothetical protein